MAGDREPTDQVFQLKIVLRGSDPPIWRRIQVPADMTLAGLHAVVQVAMGWQNCHLHQFEVAGVTYASDDGGGWGPAPKDERRSTLAQVLQPGRSIVYEYDFGDGWEHDVEVERVLGAGETTGSPTCVAGERACPPEDCGGVVGYQELLAALVDPGHVEHDGLLEWVGGQFDPEAFHVETVNRALALVGWR